MDLVRPCRGLGETHGHGCVAVGLAKPRRRSGDIYINVTKFIVVGTISGQSILEADKRINAKLVSMISLNYKSLPVI
jgi:hypothetical protein